MIVNIIFSILVIFYLFILLVFIVHKNYKPEKIVENFTYYQQVLNPKIESKIKPKINNTQLISKILDKKMEMCTIQDLNDNYYKYIK